MGSFSPFHFVILLPLLAVALAIYFVPAIIALARRHPHRLAIVLVNLFAGWSAIGWVVALVWAIVTPREVKA